MDRGPSRGEFFAFFGVMNPRLVCSNIRLRRIHRGDAGILGHDAVAYGATDNGLIAVPVISSRVRHSGKQEPRAAVAVVLDQRQAHFANR